jgi:rhodanese-related sulfurtransferase
LFSGLGPVLALIRGGRVTEIVAIRDEGLGNSSYLIDLGDGRWLALDPSRDPVPYLAATARRGRRVASTAETHLHADFVSGSRELAAKGATVIAPPATPPLASLPPEQVRRLVADGAELVDARAIAAFATGRIPARHASSSARSPTRPAGLPGGPLAVVCGHGERAMTAASLLQRQGRAEVLVAGGGTSAWAAAGRRLEPRQ